jgi:hypothetical protein
VSPPRKVVQIAVVPETDNSYQGLLALCDDGSLWAAPLVEHGRGLQVRRGLLAWEEMPNAFAQITAESADSGKPA